MEFCKEVKKPDLLLSGFLILFFLVPPALSDLLPAEILSRFLLHRSYSTPPCTSSLLEANFSYAPFLNELKRSKNDSYNSFLEFLNGRGSFTFGRKRLQTRISYEFDSYCGAVRIDSASYGIFASQHTHRIYSSLWYWTKWFKTGLQFGTLIPQNPQFSITKDEFTDYLTSDLIQCGLYITGELGPLNLMFRFDKQPIHLGEIKLQKNPQSDIYRNFPLFLTLQTAGLDVEYSGSRVTSSLGFSVSKVINSNEITTEHQMPVKLDLNAYHFNYIGKMPNHLQWKTDILIGGGWCGGYTNSTSSMNYFLTDSLLLIETQIQFGIRDSLKHQFIVEGGLFSLHSPYGFLNLAPFSQWSMLHPTAYKLYDTDLFYSEIGFTVGKCFFNKHFPLNSTLGVRFFRTSGGCQLSKRKVIIIFLDYEDCEEEKFWDEKGILFIPKIEIPVMISATKFNISIDGVIPVTFGKEKRKHGTPTKKSKPKPGDMVGGINAATNITIPIGKNMFERKRTDQKFSEEEQMH